MSVSLRVAYAGTPAFAVPALERLLASNHHVCAVFSQPDRPSGRGKKLQASPVKQAALQAGISVYQPEKMGDEQARLLQSLAVDVLVVAAYGQIIPAVVLTAPRLACINIHASILPRWRGASPIVQAILAGDRTSGVSIMRMDEGMDTGPVILFCPMDLDARVTQGQLTQDLALLGAQHIVPVLDNVEAYLQAAQAQPDLGITYAPKVSKLQAMIDWRQDADSIDRHVRAYHPAPMAYTYWQDQRVRVVAAHVVSGVDAAVPGQVLSVTRAGLVVACGQGVICITQLQLPGGRALVIGDMPDRWPVFLTPHARFSDHG